MLARSASICARFISHSVRTSVYRAPPAADPPARMTAVPPNSKVVTEAPALRKPSAMPAADVMPSLMSRIDSRARSRMASRLSLLMAPRSQFMRAVESFRPRPLKAPATRPATGGLVRCRDHEVTRGSVLRRPSRPAVVFPPKPWPARLAQSASVIASGSAGR
jgi:hypothetical protein